MVKKTVKGVTPGDGVFPPPSSVVRCPPRRQARSPFGLRDAAIRAGRKSWCQRPDATTPISMTPVASRMEAPRTT